MRWRAYRSAGVILLTRSATSVLAGPHPSASTREAPLHGRPADARSEGHDERGAMPTSANRLHEPARYADHAAAATLSRLPDR